MKALNKMNQTELRETILGLDPTNGAASIKEIDDKVLSVAKTRQELINLASGLVPEGTVFEDAKATKESEAKAAKVEANTKVLTDAGFALVEGNWKKEGSEIVVADTELSTLTAKQLTAKINPKVVVVKEEFKGYTPEDLEAFKANVGRKCSFKASSKHGIEAEKAEGVVKSFKIEPRSGRCFYEIRVEGLAKSAWTRDTNPTLEIGEMAPVDTTKEDAKKEAEAKKAAEKLAKETAAKEKKEAAEKAKADAKLAKMEVVAPETVSEKK